MRLPLWFDGGSCARQYAVRRAFFLTLFLSAAFGMAQRVGSAAPDFIPGGRWFNAEPVSVADLRGKVVLVNVWVYSCYNCYRSLPTLKRWYKDYAGQGFEIIGVHTPEFESDKLVANVEAALTREDVSWPVFQDNRAATWQAYENSVWPTFYLLDRQGTIRRVQRGEISSVFPRGIRPLERTIEKLLAEPQ